MKIPEKVQVAVLKNVDRVYRFRPQKMPSSSELANTMIIAHRGVRDDKTVFENTFDAFDCLLDTNVEGLEFDIRWSKDLEPVVFHDADAQRLFGSKAVLADHTLAEWQAMFPQIVSLEQIVKRYGKQKHLFIEIKDEVYPNPAKQAQRLSEILMPLNAVADYHFMSFSQEKLDLMSFAPTQTRIMIANMNVSDVSSIVLSNNYGGIGAHYGLVSRDLIGRHRAANQHAGLGFPSSANSLKREIGRGCRWVFTDHPLEMQALLDKWR